MEKYKLLDGREVEVAYNANGLCRICHLPVVEASMGGTNVCPWCDCGVHRDGRKWTYEEAMKLIGAGRNE